MKKARQKDTAKAPRAKLREAAKEKATRPPEASSPNLGFHGKDDEKQLNPEE